MFGKDFEFSEKYLKSKIDSETIVKALKRRYKFKKITKVTLKHVLYEGARANNILRINDEWFNKMVEILNLNLDADSDEDVPNINFIEEVRNYFNYIHWDSVL